MDIVITYVDINDEFIKKYNKYNSKLQENRFRSYNVLDLQVKLIRKYASFIKNIFIVVSDKSQVPKDLDLSLCKIVYHKDIIPEKFLPCFNSCTIEMFLHNIPELDEEFVYLNDDMFIIDYVSKKDFFLNHKPSLSISVKDKNINETNTYKKNLYNSTNLIANMLRCNKTYKDKYIVCGHGYYPLLKSVCEKVFNKNIYNIYGSLTRLRHSKNYNTSIFSNYCYIIKKYNPIEKNYIFTTTDESLDYIVKCIVDKHEKFICINDINIYEDFNKIKEQIRYALTLNYEDKKIEKKLQKESNKVNKPLNKNEKRTVLCTMAKNENLYIREWVEYYKKLGIYKIFLYDNNDINGEKFEDVIKDYIDEGFVEVRNARGKTKYQLVTYVDFYNNDSINYDWCCFFDADEFLVLNKDNNINDYLNRECFNEFDSIAINWKNYGDSDLLGNENNYDRNCLTRFNKECVTYGNKYTNDVYKKIVRCSLRKINNLESPHTLSPSLDKNVCNNKGERINGKKFKCEENTELAYLKHFCTKTVLEYLIKMKRGGGVNGLTKQYSNSNNFFAYNTKTKEKENIIKEYLSGANDYINLLVVNYNTPELIDYLIKSIKLNVKSNWKLYIFDNSDKTECVKYNDDNIIIFDNTKGDIINFNDFLEKYPKRLETWAKNNNWGSAKHCYTIEKCMNLINDNFILLDSDILLKKDISELYKDNLFYCGEIQTLKTQRLPRIAPYICFINTKLCKLYNIHYFYEDYMHGLSKEAHNYDTGGAFYKFVNKYPHLNIEYNDYITHYGQGSWLNIAKKTVIIKKDITIETWLNEYKYCYDEKELLKKNILEFSEKHYPKLHLNLDNPITIQDKINWLKIYDDTNDLKTMCADKILVHNYCKEKLGKDICIPIIKIYDSPNDININDLNGVVLKCNHGSGYNIICKDNENINLNEIKETLNTWLNEDFSYHWGYEPHYCNINRKCFIEQYMGDGIDDLIDYKISCFNGEPKIVQIMKDRYKGKLYFNYYDINFNPLYISRNDHPANYNIIDKKPKTFDIMLKYAKKLSNDFKYVRVDFYDINGKIYLGELTFTPGSGFFTYKNPDDSIKLGNLLQL